MTIISLQGTLERLTTLVRGDLRASLLEYGLQPVQFEALYYLSKCNRYSDTPMAVTEYLGQTKGTISQTLKVLEREGLIKKKGDVLDKRVSHLALTEAGQEIINKVVPSLLLSRGLTTLPEKQQKEIEDNLVKLLRAVQQGNELKSFGQCASCSHNIKSANGILCGLTEESLTEADTQLICREHVPKNYVIHK